MPTKKQLQNIWKAQFRLFGGHAVPQQSYSKTLEGLGLTEERSSDAPIEKADHEAATGDVVGTLTYDKANRKLIFTPSSE